MIIELKDPPLYIKSAVLGTFQWYRVELAELNLDDSVTFQLGTGAGVPCDFNRKKINTWFKMDWNEVALWYTWPRSMFEHKQLRPMGIIGMM